MQAKPEREYNDPREVALAVVYKVLEKGAYTNIVLDKYLSKSRLMPVDRHLVTEIVNGSIRMLKHLDWVLNLFLKKSVSSQNPWLRNILRISLYQMLFMDKVPDYACVDSAVELSRRKAGIKLSGVANGVLRNIARNLASIKYPGEVDSTQYLAVYYSQPEWLIELCLQEYGIETTRKILLYFNQRPLLVLRNNSLTGSRDELIDSLRNEGTICQPTDRTPWGLMVEVMDKRLEDLTAYKDGRFYVQNEASMLAVSILNPQAGEQIVDLCSGVGGKASFMAEMMNNIGKIDAYEIYEHKLVLLERNCERLHISIVTGHQQDILSISEGTQLAQGVLLDVPCSGLGVLNRRADSRWTKTPESISELKQIQASFIEKAGQMVAPGGRLVYSTCTINRQENQDLVQEFLSNNSEFSLEGFDRDLAFFPLDELDQKNAAEGMLTLIPGKYETDGMFYARIRRHSGS